MDRVAVINDLSCYGRASLAVQLPILSAMNYEVCPLPSALYSAHGAFQGHFGIPIKQELNKILQHWNKLSLYFDGLLCGFLPDPEQFSAIRTFFSEQKQKGSHIILDPVMGDHGVLYSVTSSNLCECYRTLLPFTDLIVPNLTECCVLLELPYPSSLPDTNLIFDYAKKLCDLGTKAVVITGIPNSDYSQNQQLKNVFYQKNGQKGEIVTKRIGCDRCGTGDIFSAFLAGYVWNHLPLPVAIRHSSDRLCQALAYTNTLNLPPQNGVCFEPFLSELKHSLS